MRILLEKRPPNHPGEILAHVRVSPSDDPPAFTYSHSFIYKVPSGDDGEIVVYTSELDAASGVNGRRFLFDLEKCNNEKFANVFHTKPKQNALHFFGTALFKALFSGDAEKSLRETKSTHANGRIFLQLNDQDLDAIPWEYAKDGTSFLVHDRKFTRLLAHEYESPRDPLPELPLHIVVVAPDPLDLTEKGYADLHLGDQFQYLINGFRGDDINVKLERVLPATVNKVNSLIAKPDSKMAPVLHFMGHCVAHNTERGLLFEDSDTFKCKAVHTSLINVPKNLRLAFLSACDSREVARVLAQDGVRHTIGSYCDLPDDIARKFEAQYYQYLSYGLSVDDTMRRSRMNNRDSEDLRQNDYLAGAMILYSTTCYMDDSKCLREAGKLIIERNMCANNLDVIPSAKIFFGRKDQLADLNIVLRRMATRTSDSANVYTITGICGQGKTTLAMKAIRRNSHFFPGGIFVWQFDDKQEISFRDYLRNLADVLFPKLLPEVAQNSADEVEILKQAISKEFNASTLLILDDADTLTRAAKIGGDASDLVTWLQNIVSWENTPVKILATSPEALNWPDENLIQLDGFIDSDIHSGCKLFFRYLNEEAKETIMANKQIKQLLRDIVTCVDGHPLSLILLSRAAGYKILEDLAHKHYRTMLANSYNLKSLRGHFEPMLNALPKQWRLLLYICSFFALPTGKENLIKISEFFDYMSSAESINAPGDLDIKLLHRRGLLIKEGDDKYRCSFAIRVIAKDLYSDFKLRISKTTTPLYQAVELLHKSFSGEFAAEMNAKNQAGWTPLHLAVNNVQVDLVKSLFDFGVDANCKCDNGQTSLHFAARKGHVEMVKLLATSGADVNAKINNKFSNSQAPVHIAAKAGHASVVELLIGDFKVYQDIKDSSGWTPLHLAAFNGYVEVVKSLVGKFHADINAKDNEGWTSLHFATKMGYIEVVRLLATSGADVNEFNDGQAPVHIAAKAGHASVVELLVGDFKVYQDIKNFSGWTPLHMAACSGHVEVVKSLVSKFHADINAKDNEGTTSLHFAAREGHIEVVRLLATSGADVNAKLINGQAAVHIAAKVGHASVVELLVGDLKVHQDIKDSSGWTPLHLAAYNGRVEVVKSLAGKFHADVNVKDNEGWTSLHFAANGGHIEVVRLLATSGADVNAKFNDGQVPVHIAAKVGHVSVVELLIGDFKVYQDIKDSSGWTPLHLAAFNGRVEVVKSLLGKFQADINAKDNMGWTSLHYAAKAGCIEVVRLLATSGADVNAKNNQGWTSLHLALSVGSTEVVRLLETLQI